MSVQVPKGYKQKEVGVIPEDWNSCRLEDFVEFLTGFPFPSNKFSEFGIKLLRGSNVKRSIIEWDEKITVFWPFEEKYKTKYLLNEGDIVIAMDGSLVGRSFSFIKEKDLPCLLVQRVARIRSKRVNQEYLKSWVCSNIFTSHCDSVKTVSSISNHLKLTWNFLP